MDTPRDIGKQALSFVVSKKKNVDMIEKYIYNATENKDDYIELIYESIASLTENSPRASTESIKSLITNIFNDRFEWDNPIYTQYRDKVAEEDQFLMNPFEIEEGVLECKCGSKRTISFQRQTRSADEGSTTFAQCVECGTRWKNSN